MTPKYVAKKKKQQTSFFTALALGGAGFALLPCESCFLEKVDWAGECWGASSYPCTTPGSWGSTTDTEFRIDYPQESLAICISQGTALWLSCFRICDEVTESCNGFEMMKTKSLESCAFYLGSSSCNCAPFGGLLSYPEFQLPHCEWG